MLNMYVVRIGETLNFISIIYVFIVLTLLPSILFQKICNIEIYLVSNYKFQIKLLFHWGRLEWPGESGLHSYISKLNVIKEQIHYELLDNNLILYELIFKPLQTCMESLWTFCYPHLSRLRF